MYRRQWGRGKPLIALHPLGLESSSFADLGVALASAGIRTTAVDLPGFGRTEALPGPLTPARLAEPVIELARRMKKPTLLGYSMGGRVALEALLTEPDAFRAGIVIAPYLPWASFRWTLQLARLMSPELAMRVPIEVAWPLLKWLADRLAALPTFRQDAVAEAGARLIYNFSCPATRAAMVSAAREMALDPAFGPAGLWTRLQRIECPTTFLWGEQDRLVPLGFAHRVAKVVPSTQQIVLPCAGHALNGPHSRCLAELVNSIVAWQQESVAELFAAEPAPCRKGEKRRLERAPCRIEPAVDAEHEAVA